MLLEQQNYYYLQNNDSEPYSINQITLDKIIHDKDNRFHLDNLYYSLDGQNIFKRIDRFRHRLLLIIIFAFLILVNFHEIFFNIIHLALKIDPDNPDRGTDKKVFFKWNLASEFLSDFYILALLFLSIYTFCKFGIDTKLYF